MATDWIPLPQRYPQHWLLGNGKILRAPELERTTGGRKVRIAGIKETAVPADDMQELVWKTVQANAKRMKTYPWMALGEEGAAWTPLDGAVPAQTEVEALNETVELYFLSEDRSATCVAWRFRHPKLPIEAQVTVTISKARHGGQKYKLVTKAYIPNTWPGAAATPSIYTMDDPQEDVPYYLLPYQSQAYTDVHGWWENHKREFLDNVPLGETRFGTERQMIHAFAKLIRHFDDLGEIQIPDLRSPEEPKWLTLRLFRTNATPGLLSALSEYLEGGTAVQALREKWAEMVMLFRHAGVVLGDLKESDFHRLLSDGNIELNFDVGPVIDEDTAEHGESWAHSVRINLVTGAVVVACEANSTRDDAAMAYEAALIKARFTGTEDELLAYVREYIRRSTGERADEMLERHAQGK